MMINEINCNHFTCCIVLKQSILEFDKYVKKFNT